MHFTRAHFGSRCCLNYEVWPFLPISQEALICGEISDYDYTGIVVEEEQKDQIIRALGPKNKILFLRNHGIACCGGSIEEAYFLALNCVAACEIQ
ncbi:putative alpha-adducin isoform X4, partial [Apostichopus japonicus]